MKPIAPQIATQAPTPKAVRQTISSRSRRMSWPSDCGDLLAEREAVERPRQPEQQQRSRASAGAAAKAAWARLRSTSEPISQS